MCRTSVNQWCYGPRSLEKARAKRIFLVCLVVSLNTHQFERVQLQPFPKYLSVRFPDDRYAP